MTEPTELYEDLLERSAGTGVERGAMFGSLAFMVHGKSVGCIKGGVIAFKLGAGSQEHADALALDGAGLFDPSGKHRPFKDWVELPLASPADFASLLSQAVAAALT